MAGGCAFLTIWVAMAMVLSDGVLRLNMLWQFAYFAGAGLAWVLPVGWLMIWAARTP